MHLSDLHISKDRGPDREGVDARAVLAALLQDCHRLKDVDLVVVSGDIADDGSPEGYAAALEIVGAFSSERRAALVWCTGNHDSRAPFAASLGSGHLDADLRDVGQLVPDIAGERAAVSQVGGFRVITLDSLVPGEVAGRLSHGQLEWLREVLKRPSGAGSILVLHHPPISVSPQWAAASLQAPEELANVIRDTDVRLILCGHVHAQVTGHLAGVPVLVGPGVITRIDLTAPASTVRAVRGAAASVVEMDGPYAPMSYALHARDSRAGEQVYLANATTWEYLDDEDQLVELGAS